MKFNLTVMLALILLSARVPAAEVRVGSAAEITRAAATAQPGDTLLMVDGVWTDQVISLKARGAATAPITLRPQTPGQVVLVGASAVEIGGEYLVVSGLLLSNATFKGDGFKVIGTNCRLTECAVLGGRHKTFVHLYGLSNRVDHCYLAGKTNDSPTMQIEVERVPNHHRLDHNHFGPRPPLGRNGGETLRVGYSHQSMSNSCSLVEQNLFDRCDGELEIISNKSCENTYRANTFLDCAGTLTLRHGNRCVVEGNFFLGHHKRGTGGIRVIGEDHLIFNNYFDGLQTGAFWITAGISNSQLNGYFQARRCVIAFNTVVDSSGNYLDLEAGFCSARRTLRPENITIANNLLSVAPTGRLLKGEDGRNFDWLGNLTAGVPADHRGITATNLNLNRGKDGLWRPASDSPALATAVGNWPQLAVDMDGQLRAGRLDIGSDQVSDAPIKSRPLTAADVGPVWMKRNDASNQK